MTTAHANKTFIPLEEIGLCNCTVCCRPLIGERTQEKLASGLYWVQWRRVCSLMRWGKPAYVAARVSDRPYCNPCARSMRIAITNEVSHDPDL